MKTIVQTELSDDGWVATTPHDPSLRGEAHEESAAINQLVAEIRNKIDRGGDAGVSWEASPRQEKDGNKITRHLTGCWPHTIIEPKPLKTAKRKEISDGTD